MSITDTISVAALITSLLSLVISIRALRETRKSNRIALLERRASIYDVFHQLVLDALTQGVHLEEETVAKFSSQLVEVEKFLPQPLASEVALFHQDCECVVWGRSLTRSIAEEHASKVNAAAVRINRTGLELDQKFLALIREATGT